MPISVAVEIASGNDHEVQRALSEAYEKGDLRGSKLTAAKRIIAQRIEEQRQVGRDHQTRRKLTLLEVTRPELLVEALTSRKLEAKSTGARVMLEQETDFLLRDLKAVEQRQTRARIPAAYPRAARLQPVQPLPGSQFLLA